MIKVADYFLSEDNDSFYAQIVEKWDGLPTVIKYKKTAEFSSFVKDFKKNHLTYV